MSTRPVINKCYNNTRVHEQLNKPRVQMLNNTRVHDQSLINVIITQEYMNSH